MIRNKNLNFIKKTFCYERSILDKIVLKIVSVAVHRNDDQKQKIKFFENIFFERSFLQKNFLDFVSLGTHRNDDQKRELEFYKKI